MRKALSRIMRPNPRRCEEARALMSEYVDGELDRAQRKRVERHVRFCERCRTVLGNLRRTLAQLRSLQVSEPPGSDADPVAERIGRAWRERV